MVRAASWKLNGKRSREERKHERRHIVLKDAAISSKTQERYYLAMNLLLPILVGIDTFLQLDSAICEWIQQRWEDGESIHVISDALCALHHYEPWTKRQIPESWRMFAIWRRLESPNRAPPLTAEIVYAIANFALDRGQIMFAAMLLLGFFGLLRTGEMLQVCSKDLLIGSTSGICRLVDTKTGKRNMATEVVSIEDDFSLQVLKTASQVHPSRRTPIWSFSASSFRNTFNWYLNYFQLGPHGFRPYSLRRGGATHIFQVTGSMEVALVKGRWGSSRVARVYISDGMSFLPSLTFSRASRDLINHWNPFYQQSKTVKSRDRGKNKSLP